MVIMVSQAERNFGVSFPRVGGALMSVLFVYFVWGLTHLTPFFFYSPWKLQPLEELWWKDDFHDGFSSENGGAP